MTDNMNTFSKAKDILQKEMHGAGYKKGTAAVFDIVSALAARNVDLRDGQNGK